MSLLSDLLGMEPKWARSLPAHLKPSAAQISRLEKIRATVGVGHDDFFMHILGHPETTKKLQRHLYRQLRSQRPEWLEAEVLEGVLMSRITGPGVHDPLHGSGLFGLDLQDPDIEEKLHTVITRYATIDALAEAMVNEEMKRPSVVPPLPGYEDVARQVTLILAEPQ